MLSKTKLVACSSTMSDSTENGNGGDRNENSSWTEQAKEWLSLNMDNERSARLKQCRILQDTLTACRKNAKLKQVDADRLHLEASPPGMRMVTFFRWRHVHDYDATCQREEHSLWACRGVALQCGQELTALRECFNEKQGLLVNGEVVDAGEVLKHKRTAYESNKKTKPTDVIPCREMQEKIGMCIAENSKALALRHLERNAKERDEN